MEHGSGSLFSLMMVVSVAFVVPVLLHKLKIRIIPVVVAEILAGLVIGRSGLDLIQNDPWVELLSLLGFIYLMFLSGLEIDVSALRSRASASSAGAYRPLRMSLILVAGMMLVSFALSLGLMVMGFVSDPFLMTLIISTISLGVVVPVLKEKRMLDTELGQTILLVTVLSDFLTMILLALYISLSSNNTLRMLTLLLFFVLVFLSYFFMKKFHLSPMFAALGKGTVQIGTRAVFALILLFVVLSETLGAENILGAFLAGLIVSMLVPDRSFAHKLDTFGYGFLIPIFFVMTGARMELWGLLSSPKVLLFIPLLLAFMFISKLIPALALKRRFGWRNAVVSSVILSSTLSLVIAASTIAFDLGIIDEAMNGALILVAVLSCLIFPVIFNKISPSYEAPMPSVSIVGANHVTLPVYHELVKEGVQVQIFSTSQSPEETGQETSTSFNITTISSLSVEELEHQGAFEKDTIVLGLLDHESNIRLAREASARGVERIIVRIEEPGAYSRLKKEEGFTVFSTLYSANMLLKALIEHPSAVRLLTQHDESLQEVQVGNSAYHKTLLRQLPFLGDALIMRIYREESFIIPHGNTEIRLGDRLLVGGRPETIASLRKELY